MPQASTEQIDLVVTRLCQEEALLERFLREPGVVFTEICGAAADQATLEAVGERLRERYAGSEPSELTEAELEKAAAAGSLAAQIRTWKPFIGRSISFSGVYTSTSTY